MIVVQNRFVFLSNPRTASRAFLHGFINAGVTPPGTPHQHITPEELQLDISYKHLPRIAILRNPIHWALSYYFAFGKHVEFMDWINQPMTILPWATNRLNAYAGIADGYFLYEWGIETIFEMIGIESGSIPLIGSTTNRRPDCFELKDHFVDAILNKFHKDANQYEWYYNALEHPQIIEPDPDREVIDSLVVSAVAGPGKLVMK